jgi:hypothetical protein
LEGEDDDDKDDGLVETEALGGRDFVRSLLKAKNSCSSFLGGSCVETGFLEEALSFWTAVICELVLLTLLPMLLEPTVLPLRIPVPVPALTTKNEDSVAC